MEDDNEDCSMISESYSKLCSQEGEAQTGDQTVRRDFYKNSTKPSLKNIGILGPSAEGSLSNENDKNDLFLSMLSFIHDNEEFKEHESPLLKGSRYSLSPKNNKNKLKEIGSPP